MFPSVPFLLMTLNNASNFILITIKNNFTTTLSKIVVPNGLNFAHGMCYFTHFNLQKFDFNFYFCLIRCCMLVTIKVENL